MVGMNRIRSSTIIPRADSNQNGRLEGILSTALLTELMICACLSGADTATGAAATTTAAGLSARAAS